MKILKLSLFVLAVLFGVGLFFSSNVHATTPTASISLSPSTIPNGGTTTVTWTSTGTMACYGTGAIQGGEWGYLQPSGSKTFTYNFLPGSYPLGISCTLPSDGSYATGAQTTLTVTGPVINNFSFTPSDITVGTASSVNSNFTLAWSTTGATSCTAIPVVDLSGVEATYEQGGSFPGQATFWSGDVGTSGSRSLSLPKTAWPNTYTFGLTCRDANGTSTTVSESLNATWIEGKPKVVRVTSPVNNTSWTPGSPQTITWNTTNLSSTLNGVITLQSKTMPSKTYYVAHHVLNTGSYTWNGRDNYALTNNYVCGQNGAPESCFTLSTTPLPAGAYDLVVTFFANPSDVFEINRLGQFIVNGLPSNIVGMMPFFSNYDNTNTLIPLVINLGSSTPTPTPTPTPSPTCSNLYWRDNTDKTCQTQKQFCGSYMYFGLQTFNTKQSCLDTGTAIPPAECLGGPTAWGCNPPPVLGCSAGNLYNTSTGKPCVNNVGNENQNASVYGGYAFGNTTLYRGVRGDGVMELQRFLNTTLNLNLVLDGKFGPKTTAIVKEWQRSHGLKEDGRVGPKTKAMMNSEAK